MAYDFDAACAYTLYHEDVELEKLRLEAMAAGGFGKMFGGGDDEPEVYVDGVRR